MNREELIEIIKDIHKNEKFKQDAFFFCGYPSDRPNETIIKACKSYIDGEDGAKEELITAFETELNKEPELEKVKNILDSRVSLEKVLENKDML